MCFSEATTTDIKLRLDHPYGEPDKSTPRVLEKCKIRKPRTHPESHLMKPSPRRRLLLSGAAILPLLALPPALAGTPESLKAQAALEDLEKNLSGRLGLFALDTGNGRRLRFRAEERFPMCSTFKFMLAAATLARSVTEPGLLAKRIPFSAADLQSYAPVCTKHLGEAMSLEDLCAAAMEYSDNTAANLLIRELGGPAEITRFARSIGDPAFRLDRIEPELNSAIPGDERDTTTPEAMAASLRRLVLGEALPLTPRKRLEAWLLDNKTGAGRIRAGLPADWQVGDKTGTGAFGTANDIAVLWPPHRAPIVLTIYTTRTAEKAAPRNDLLAEATRIVVSWANEAP